MLIENWGARKLLIDFLMSQDKLVIFVGGGSNPSPLSNGWSTPWSQRLPPPGSKWDAELALLI